MSKASAVTSAPPLLYPGAKLADQLDVQHATHSIVFDAAGRPRCGGGIDSDETHSRDRRSIIWSGPLDDLFAPVASLASRQERRLAASCKNIERAEGFPSQRPLPPAC